MEETGPLTRFDFFADRVPANPSKFVSPPPFFIATIREDKFPDIPVPFLTKCLSLSCSIENGQRGETGERRNDDGSEM